jgi:hypothetical protein
MATIRLAVVFALIVQLLHQDGLSTAGRYAQMHNPAKSELEKLIDN